jgi:hypothetical protein
VEVTPQYFAVSSDADWNPKDGQITANESAPYPSIGTLTQTGWTFLYKLTGSFNGINPSVTPAQAIKTPFQVNDLFIPISSSQYPGFTPLPSPLQAVPGNHNSIANCSSPPGICTTPQLVFTNILKVQPVN